MAAEGRVSVRGHRSRLVRFLLRGLALYGFSLLVVLHTPITEWLAQPLYDQAAVVRADAIVVLDAWASVDGELNESGLRRSLHGARLYRERAAPVVVLTGSSRQGPNGGTGIPQMRELLSRLGGVNGEALVLEENSLNTHESAEHVGALARARGWASVVLVTDAMHMRRASLAFAKAGLVVAPAPVLTWDLGGAQPSLRLRRLGALAHEYGGLLFYWWKGWI